MTYSLIQNPIGAAWLMRYATIEPAFPLYIISQIGGRRETRHYNNVQQETYQEVMRPADTVAAHLQFHLRHEVVHLEMLARLFETLGGDAIQQWIDNEPTGQYARRAAFLYEWLTGKLLDVPSNIGGNYVNALNSEKLVTASPDHVRKNQRWRVNDNLAGTPDFCPMLIKTDRFNQSAALPVSEMIDSLNDEFGEDLLMRASVWMTLRESKASFAIEGESHQAKRIERFADVMARKTGQGQIPLDSTALSTLQQGILGNRSAIQQFGFRQSPVFVGQTQIRGLKEIVHYIAPPASQIAGKIEGLKAFVQKTTGQSSVMRSAVTAFAFVYIHPLADGNGRIHRFLINDILRRDDVIQAPMIIPVSQAIAEHPADRNAYNKILDTVSVPLMLSLNGHYRFNKEATIYPDGIRSNLSIDVPVAADMIWRYMDLTPHVQYLSDLMAQVITQDMQQESKYLRQHDMAREAIKEIIEMPNEYIDRIIRSIQQTQGKRSQKLVKEFTFLEDDDIWQELVAVVDNLLEDEQG